MMKEWKHENLPIFSAVHGHAHPKLAGTWLHATPDHESVARLKNMQGTADCWNGQSGNEYGDVMFGVLASCSQLIHLFIMLLLPFQTFIRHHSLHCSFNEFCGSRSAFCKELEKYNITTCWWLVWNLTSRILSSYKYRTFPDTVVTIQAY